MSIDEFDIFGDYFMGTLASSLCIVLVYLLRKKTIKTGILSPKSLIFIYVLCIFRGLFPLELPGAISIRCQLLVPIADFLFFTPIYFRNMELSGWQLVTTIYFIIVFLFFIRLLYYYTKANKALGQANVISNDHTIGILKKVICEEKKNYHICLVASSDISIPISTGIKNNKIVLPINYSDIYTDKELYYILKHEFTHIINHDPFKKLLINIASCFLFWNPCLKLLKKDYIQSIELMCDSKIVSSFSLEEKAEYLNTMMTAIKNKATVINVSKAYTPALSFVSNEAVYITERFLAIRNPNNIRNKKTNIIITSLIAIMILCSYLFIIYAQYDPPLEEIIDGPDCYSIDLKTDYIIVSKDGSATMYLSYGIQTPATEEDIKHFQDYGGKVIYE